MYAIGFTLLSLAFITLRARFLDHLLMWDEAWNILSLKAFLLNTPENPFYWYIRFHPPLYMIFAALLSPFSEGFALRAQGLSLLFSFGTFAVSICIALRLGGRRYALLTALFLCFMPLSLGYDTWIKRDSLAMLAGYLAILLILRRRIYIAALALGLSLLSKESGFFFAIASVITLFMVRKEHRISRAAVFCLISAAVSAWWYIYFSGLTGKLSAFYFTDLVYGSQWSRPLYYYAAKLVTDTGFPALIFFLTGLFCLPYFALRKQRPELQIPLIVFAGVFIPISFIITTKTPWLSYSAGPAIAMISAGGALFVLGRSGRYRLLKTSVLFLLVLTVLNGCFFSYTAYHEKTYPNGWPGAKVSRDLAVYLNRHMQKADRLMLSDFAYWNSPICPVFVHYWSPRPVSLFKGTDDPEDILQKAKEGPATWLVVADSPDPENNYRSLVQDLTEMIGKGPEQAGWSFIWKIEGPERR